MSVCEIFISYRRSESSKYAQMLYQSLTKRGYTTYYDIDSQESGNFKEAIKENIDTCTNFIVLLNTNTLSNCDDEKDWIRIEIEEALKEKRNIIPIFCCKNFEFPKELPKEIADIRYQNGIVFDENDYDDFIIKLIKKFLVDKSRIHSDSAENFIISDGILEGYSGESYDVNIPDGVIEIGEGAFKDKTKIEKIKFPASLRKISKSAFERCRNLEYVEFSENIEYIGDRAFCRDAELQSLKLNDILRQIGEEAFAECDSLKWVSLNRKLEFISPSAFNDSRKLERIEVKDKNLFYSSLDGILYNKDKSKLIRCPANYAQESVCVPKGVKTIGEYAFDGCLNIRTLELPSGVEQVENFAFRNCINMGIIKLPSSICEFEVSAFEGISGSTEIVFAEDFDKGLKKQIEEYRRQRKILIEQINNYRFVLVQTTFESVSEAKQMAKLLIFNHLMVSGHIQKISSLYYWDNKVCDEPEYELSCITTSALMSAVKDFIREHHSYENCQVLTYPITDTTKDFGSWISDYVLKEVKNDE